MSDPNTAQNPQQPGALARMKLARYNILLAVVLLVQIGLAAFVFWPNTSSAAGGEPLLGDLTVDDVTAMTITDNNDRSVRVERGDDGWVLADSDGYPAKTEEITTTLTSLLDVTTDRLVTRTGASHSRLQVADDNFLRRIDLETADGDITVYLGSSSGASATHVRLAGEDAAYLTNKVTTWSLDAQPSSWIDINYFNLSTDSITAVTLENANGRFEFVKVGDEWTLADAKEDENVAPANINTLVSRIADVNMTRPLGTTEDPAYGMDDPSAVVTIEVKGEDGTQTYTLTQGSLREEDDLYPFKSSESPYYVLVAKYTGDALAEKQRSDFMIAEGADEDEESDNAAAEDAAADDAPAAESSTEDTTTEDAATEDAATEDGGDEDAPAENATSDDAADDTPAEDTAAEDAAADDAAAESTATPQPTAEATPAD